MFSSRWTQLSCLRLNSPAKQPHHTHQIVARRRQHKRHFRARLGKEFALALIARALHPTEYFLNPLAQLLARAKAFTFCRVGMNCALAALVIVRRVRTNFHRF